MKVRKIKVTAYRGIRDAEIPIGEGGVIAKGRCESGKTSFLDAIRAALVAQGVAPSDIHHGADKAEIIVEADTLTTALRIRRGITKNGTTLSVKNGDGFSMDAPQTRLREMLGGGGFDPVDFFMADDKKRRQIILDATPIQVTEDDVSRWIPGEAEPDAVVSLAGHGLEALGRLRKHYYDLRTEANKRAKAEADDAARIEQEAAALAPNRADDLDAKAIEDEAERARSAMLDVEARQKAAAMARAASGEARGRIAALRIDAKNHAEAAAGVRPAAPVLAAAETESAEAANRVAALRVELETAVAVAEQAQRKLHRLRNDDATADRQEQAASDARRRADELEAALASAAPEVPVDEVNAVADAYNAAVIALSSLDAAKEEGAVRQKAEARRAAANAAAARAAELDRIVGVLTETAPAELAARGNLIPGFDVEKMALDGVPLDTLSGGQKLEFAVRLAKRSNPEGRILIVDGLERLDGDRLESFVKLATADGWQLIGSRVERGEIQFEAIESDPGEAAVP